MSYVVLGILLFLTGNNPASQARSTASAAADTIRAVENAQEVLMRAQVEEMRRTDDRLLSTVHWSLYVTVGIGIALIGFGWWQNAHVYDRDMEALSRRLAADLEQRLSPIQASLEQIVDERVAAAEGNVKRILEKQYNYLRRGILLTMMDQALSDVAERAQSKDIESRLRAHSQVLNFSTQLEIDENIGIALDNIRKLLTTNTTVPGAKVTTSLMEYLSKVPAKFSADSEAIKELIRRKKAAP